MKEEILIAQVTKQEILGFDRQSIGPVAYRKNFCSFSRDALIEHLQTEYKVTFVKDESDDFPYFTDGGFKFNWEDTYWKYEVTAHPYKII